MSDKAKDMYSGFKKILRSPSVSSSAGRRSSSGSFSFSGALASFSLSTAASTSSVDSQRTSTLSAKGYDDADLTAAAAAAADEMFNDHSPADKPKKERRSSFSFASWKEKHREKKYAKQAQKDAEKVAAYGATAATPRAGSSRADMYGRSNSTASNPSTTPRNNITQLQQQQPPPGLTRSVSLSGATPSSSYGPPSLKGRRSVSGRVLETTYESPRGIPTTRQNQNSFTSSSKPLAITPKHVPAPAASFAASAAPSKTPPSSSASSTARPRSSTSAAPRENVRRETASRNRAASSLAATKATSHSYSFSQRQQEKTRTADRASTMIVDDVATIVKPRQGGSRKASPTWDSDSDEDNDSFEDARPRTRGFSRRSISMDFMEPQQATHLISKIWRKLPIQARLYGRNSVDLDLEKDRTSISRSSASKHLHGSGASDEYAIPSSPLPDESNIFGDKHIRFNHKVTFTPAEGAYMPVENYDDVLVRVCQFEAHDLRRSTVKVQDFLERSMCYLRGTATRRGQKVSISNGEIRYWRRLARHDWSLEESIEPPLLCGGKDVLEAAAKSKASAAGPNARSHSSSSVTEEETDDDDVAGAPDMAKITKLREVVNYCLNSGDCLFTIEDVEELATLELLVEEDGWI